MAKKPVAPAEKVVAFTIDIGGDGSIAMDRLEIEDGVVLSREPFITRDMAQITMAMLEQKLRHVRLSGGTL